MSSWERKVKCLKIFNCKYITLKRWQDLGIYSLPWLYYCLIIILIVIGRLFCMRQVTQAPVQAIEFLRKARLLAPSMLRSRLQDISAVVRLACFIFATLGPVTD